MKRSVWTLILWGMLQLTRSQESFTEGTKIDPTPVGQNDAEIAVSSTSSDNVDLLTSFIESTPISTESKAIGTWSLETPDQQDVLTLTLINATTSSQLEDSMKATLDPKKMIKDTYSLGTQNVNHFVLLASDSGEDDADDGIVNTISPTPVIRTQLPTSQTENSTSFFSSESTVIVSTTFHTAQIVSSVYNETKFNVPTDFQEVATEIDVENETKIGFVMKFQSDCITDDINKSFVSQLLDEMLKNNSSLIGRNFTVVNTSNICERIIAEMPVLLEGTRTDVQEIVKSLNKLVGNANITVNSSGKNHVLNLISVVPFPSNTSDGASERNKDLDEYLPYVIIGGVFGGILLIVLVLMCGKCLCRCRKKKRPKKPEFEVPHLSLRPEDYILTRIPRPTTIYADNMASPIMHHDDVSISSGQACYDGDQQARQSFETSVVPMDDIIRDEDPYYRYKKHEYLPDDSSTELRTFNGKRLHHRSTETDNGVLYRNPYSSASTEKIHDLTHRRSRDLMGVDNHGYMRA